MPNQQRQSTEGTITNTSTALIIHQGFQTGGNDMGSSI